MFILSKPTGKKVMEEVSVFTYFNLIPFFANTVSIGYSDLGYMAVALPIATSSPMTGDHSLYPMGTVTSI